MPRGARPLRSCREARGIALPLSMPRGGALIAGPPSWTRQPRAFPRRGDAARTWWQGIDTGRAPAVAGSVAAEAAGWRATCGTDKCDLLVRPESRSNAGTGGGAAPLSSDATDPGGGGQEPARHHLLALCSARRRPPGLCAEAGLSPRRPGGVRFTDSTRRGPNGRNWGCGGRSRCSGL